MSACVACGKSENLKHCSKCKTTLYCSRDCQKANWKVHKKTCDRGQKASTSSGFSPQVHRISNPSDLLHGTSDEYLHNLPEREVFRRLIDSFRLRVEDDYCFKGELKSLYGGEDPHECFSEFLNLLEVGMAKLLPKWWNKDKRRACEILAADENGDCFVGHAVEKHDIQEMYKDNLMPMKLRVIAEKVYGSPVM